VSGQLIQVTAAENRLSGMFAPACATPDSNASSSAQGWGEAPAVHPAAAAAGPPATARSHRRSNSEFTGPGSPYLDRDAERAYLTQIIKDDGLVSAFLAHRFFRWE
jgi:hypothetical protein